MEEVIEVGEVEKIKEEISELILRKNLLELQISKLQEELEKINRRIANAEFELKRVLFENGGANERFGNLD